MNITFEDRIVQKQASREARARLTWEEKVTLIERMKIQLTSWKRPSKSSIASKPRD
jgi:hypothetical protein